MREIETERKCERGRYIDEEREERGKYGEEEAWRERENEIKLKRDTENRETEVERKTKV